MMDPRRDLNAECGYPLALTTNDYRQMWERDGIAARVVSVYPEECWASDPDVYETDDAKETEWEKQWDLLCKEHNLLHYLERIDILSGVGQFGVLLFGIDDGQELDQPVDGMDEKGETKGGEKKRELLYLRTFDESLVTIHQFEADVKNPRYGQPTMYEIKFQDPSVNQNSASTTTESVSKKVHWHRVLHVADNRTSSEVFGTPRLRCVFNRIADIMKVLGGSAEMFWKGAFPGIVFEVNPDSAGAEIDPVAMREEFDRYQNGLQRYLATSGVTAKSLGVQVASPEAHFNVHLQAITIAMACPLRIFMGSEAAHLASTQDKETWNVRLMKRITKYVIPMVLRKCIARLMSLGVLPYIEEYITKWKSLNNPSEKDKADVAKVWVEVMAQYITAGIDTLIPPDLFLTMFMDMTTEEADAILEAAQEQIDKGGLLDEVEPPPVPGMPPAVGPDGKPVPPNALPNAPNNPPPAKKGPPDVKPPTAPPK